MNKRLLVSIIILSGWFYFTDFGYSKFNVGIIGAIKNKGNELTDKVEKKREEISTINNSPNIPSNPTPIDGATEQSVNVDISWTGGDPDTGDTVTYDIYFGALTNPPLVLEGQTSTTYNPGTLSYGNTYYWKIVAKDNNGAFSTGPVWGFETLNDTTSNNSPNIPSNPTPIDGATEQSVNVDISWTGGDPDAGDTVTYDIYFGGSTNPPLVLEGQTSTTYDPGTLFSGNTYYWKIVSEDNHGASTTGPVWQFETLGGTPKVWGTAQLIETDNAGSAWYPQVGKDSNGNAIAVWHQDDGTRDNIWSNRYVPGTGWGTAQIIETNNAGGAYLPRIAMNSSGNAFVVWHQSDGTRYSIWSNRYVSGTGWETAQLIETDNAGSAWRPHVAIDSSGNAIAVWYQYDGTRYNIYSNRYVSGTGWGTVQLIETDNTAAAKNSRIAMNLSGNAIAIWEQYDGTRDNIWSNRYVPGTGWGTAQLIETNNAGTALYSDIAIDSNGDAFGVWYQYDGIRANIWSNRYESGTGWGTAQLIETDNADDAEFPQVSMDLSGNAIVVWCQSDGTRFNIWSNRYVSGMGWGTAELIETDNTGDAWDPQVAIDSSGNAIAAWTQFVGTTYSIYSNRYELGTGWGTPELIETDNAGSTGGPMITIDSNGDAIAVWQQSDGSRENIWSNRYE